MKQLEKEIGIVFSNSPTHNVGYNISDELAEVEHNHPMLSLDKTKSINELIQFAGYNNCFLSVKCDGLTTSLRYLNGKLISAETRGNGTKGQDVLQNVLTKKFRIKTNLSLMVKQLLDGTHFEKLMPNYQWVKSISIQETLYLVRCNS